MLVFKAFYFFFIPAWAGLVTYFPIYLKQLGLSASYAGILVGMAPIQRGIGAAGFGYLADKTNTGKLVLLVSLAANALTPALYLIPQPREEACTSQTQSNVSNETEINRMNLHLLKGKLIYNISSSETITKLTEAEVDGEMNEFERVVGHEKDDMNELQKTSMDDELAKIFWILLTMVIVGEFLCGPARNIVDAALLQTLGSDSNDYGSIRVWGSFGQLPLFTIVSLLAILIPPMTCDSPVRDNYAPALYLASSYRIFAFVCGLQIKFEPKRASYDHPGISEPDDSRSVCEVLLTFRNSTLIIIAFYLGIVDGQFYSFMFWYLVDISPTQASWIMAVAVICRVFAAGATLGLAGRVFKAIGVFNAIHCSLGMYILAYITYGLLRNPWLAIIPEVIQAAAFPLSISAFIVYFGKAGPTSVAATLQGVVQFCYNGVGFGVGCIISGPIMDSVGGSWMFLLFGGVTAIMILFSILTQQKSIWMLCVHHSLCIEEETRPSTKESGSSIECNATNVFASSLNLTRFRI